MIAKGGHAERHAAVAPSARGGRHDGVGVVGEGDDLRERELERGRRHPVETPLELTQAHFGLCARGRGVGVIAPHELGAEGRDVLAHLRRSEGRVRRLRARRAGLGLRGARDEGQREQKDERSHEDHGLRVTRRDCGCDSRAPAGVRTEERETGWPGGASVPYRLPSQLARVVSITTGCPRTWLAYL